MRSDRSHFSSYKITYLHFSLSSLFVEQILHQFFQFAHFVFKLNVLCSKLNVFFSKLGHFVFLSRHLDRLVLELRHDLHLRLLELIVFLLQALNLFGDSFIDGLHLPNHLRLQVLNLVIDNLHLSFDLCNS